MKSPQSDFLNTINYKENSMIHTNEVQEHADRLLVPHDHIEINGRSLSISKLAIQLSAGQIESMQQHIASRLETIPSEHATFVQQNHKLPTLIARIDCTVSGEGVMPYEVEERPAGLDVTAALLGLDFTEQVRSHFQETTGTVPVVARRPDQLSDDGHVLDVVDLNSVGDQLCIVRARPGQLNDVETKQLQERSLSTVATEGVKTHTVDGTDINYAKDVVFDHDVSIVIKPKQGTHAHGVAVYLSPDDRIKHGKKGTITAAKMQKIMEANPDFIVERFASPISLRAHDGKIGNMILRVFGLVHPGMDIQIIGGAYVIRPELVVHGASNAIAGGVVL